MLYQKLTLAKIFAITALLSACIKLLFLDQNNLMHNDESSYITPARTLLRTDTPALEELQLIGNLEKSYFFAGRLLVYAHAAFFSVVPFNTFTMRLPVFICFVLSAFLIYKISKKLFSTEIAAVSSCLFLMVPTFFFRLHARPEPFNILLLLSCILLLLYIKEVSSRLKLFLLGILASTGFWIHLGTPMIAILAVYFITWIYLGFLKSIFVALGSLAGFLCFYLLYMLPNYNDFAVQLEEIGIFLVKGHSIEGAPVIDIRSFLMVLDVVKQTFFRVEMLPLTAILLVSVFKGLNRHKEFYLKIFLPVMPGVLIASVMSAHGGMNYVAYLTPFIAISIALLVMELKGILRISIASALLIYLAAAQLIVTKYKSEDLKKTCDAISSVISKEGAVMGAEYYNITFNKRDYYSCAYYTFWRKLYINPKLSEKYKTLFGNSFVEFLKKFSVKYLIIDRSFFYSSELLRELTGSIKLLMKLPSRYGGEDGTVDVYEISF